MANFSSISTLVEELDRISCFRCDFDLVFILCRLYHSVYE